MSYQRETKVGVGTPPSRMNNPIPGGPLVATQEPADYNNTSSTTAGAKAANVVRPRTKLEQIGFTVIVISAIVLLVVLAGFILPPLIGGIITATYVSAFVAFLTLLNLRTPSKWGNAVLGRRVFPVLSAGQDSDVWKLAGVNAVLVFCFTFFYQVLAATLVGPFLAGILVFGGLVGAGVFYNRARKVIVKP
jgi:hypothetical protein